MLEVTPSDELLTRARLLSLLGRTLCWRYDEEGRRDADSLREADARFAESAELYERLGMRAAAAGTAPYRSMWIEFARGNAARAGEMLDEAMESVAGRPRRWAYLLTMRAEVRPRARPARRVLARVRRDPAGRRAAQGRAAGRLRTLERDGAASRAGDAKAVLEHLRAVESNKGDWWPAAGGDFCAWAVEALARVGEIALAHEHLRLAREVSTDADALIAMAEGSLLARHGDPEAAEVALRRVPGTGIDPREYWRIDLLRAYAAFRRADRSAGPLAARAFERAAALGLEHLPLDKEREVTEQLAGLAAETGLPAHSRSPSRPSPSPCSCSVAARSPVAGRTVAVSPGQGLQLLKLVAVSGGRVPAERAIESLWPDVGVDAGRNRLRTVLNRLRNEAGDVLVREADTLVLDPTVTVDLVRFEEDARRATALGRAEPALAVALARAAISRYRGELLPDDPYEEWTEAPRRHARRTVLELLQLCCDVATASGDLDETRWAVERAIDLAPDDDRWYLTAARTLVAQGRRGGALAVLRRARRDLEAQGFDHTDALDELERELAGTSA